MRGLINRFPYRQAFQCTATVLAAVLFCSCGAVRSVVGTPDDGSTPRQSQDLAAAVALVASEPAPATVDAATFSELKQAFVAVLRESGSERFISGAPLSDLSAVDDLTATSLPGDAVRLDWTYRNQGDTNQDKLVNASDLTPIGVHYGKTEAAPDWSAASFADTDGNGIVGLGDITPLGQNYLSTVDEYAVEFSVASAPGTWVELVRVAFEQSTLTEPGTPRTFSVEIPDITEPGFFRVIPCHDQDMGVPSNQAITGGVPGLSVSGVCLDVDGTPLSGVEVVIDPFPPVLSSPDGSFAVTGVAADHEGYIVPRLAGVSFEPTSLHLAVGPEGIDGLEFRASTIPVYAIYLDPVYIAELDEELWSADYKPGDTIVDGELFEGTGIRYRGGAAMTFPKKSWKVDFPDEQYDDPQWGYKRGKLNLQAEYTDTTLMREKLSYDLMQDFGMLAPRARFVKLYVNDEYFGLVTDVENPRKDWLEEFGYSRDGALYKSVITRFFPEADYAGYEAVFEKEFPDDEPYDDLIGFVEAVNSWLPVELGTNYPMYVNMEQLENYFVVYCLVSMADHMETNYLLYHDSQDTGLWSIIPWDHDRTWGHRWDDELGFFSLEIIDDTPIDYGNFYGDEEGWGNVLYDRYFNSPVFWNEYKAALQSALDNEFGEDLMIQRIDDYAALIRDAALADPNKWGENADWDQRIEDLREYVRLRRAFIQTAIDAG